MNKTQATSFLRRVSLVGIYGGLLVPLMFIPIVIFPFVFSKLIYFQLLVGLTFPAYLLLAWMEPGYRPRKHLLYGAIAAYFLSLFLSMAFSVDSFRSWWGNQERMNGLFTLLHFFAWLTMATGILRTWEAWRKLLVFEVILSAFMAVVALLQKVIPNLLFFPAGPRVGGLLDNPIYMAAYQIFNLFFLLLLVLKGASRHAKYLYAGVAILDIAAFIAAQSRGATVGLIAGLIVFGAFVAVFSQRKKIRYASLGVIGLLVIGVGLLIAFRNAPMIVQSPLGRFTNFSSPTRLIAWRIAWQGFLERPIFGWGIDTFHLLFNQKYNPLSLGYGSYETWFDRSHNTILDVLSMTGSVGFLTYAFMYLALLYCVWRAFHQGRIDLPIAAVFVGLTAGYFVQNLFVFDHPAAFSMSYLLFALVIGMTARDEKHASGTEGTSSSGRKFSWYIFVPLQLLALLLVWRTSILPFQASRYSIKSNNQFILPSGLEYAKAAANIWTPYLDEQTFLLSRNLITISSQGNLGKVAHAKEYYDLAMRLTAKELSRHPLNTHTHFVNAQLAYAMSSIDPRGAETSIRKYDDAIKTSPKRQQLFFALAAVYKQQGKIDEALVQEKMARDFNDQVGEARWMYGVTLFYDKQNRVEGAKEIIASQTVSHPYRPVDARHLIPIADAYFVMQDVEGLKRLADRVTTTPPGPGTAYAQLALKYHLIGLLEEKEKILAHGEKVDPSVRAQFDQMLKGTQLPVETIKPAAGKK